MDEPERVAAEGETMNGEIWTLFYGSHGAGGRHHLRLVVNEAERGSASGFDLPRTTEIGFGGGLTPGRGNYYLFGLVTARICTVRAEGPSSSDATTEPLSGTGTRDSDPLRTFVLVRPPIDDVTALLGLDRDGRTVQKIAFPRAP